MTNLTSRNQYGSPYNQYMEMHFKRINMLVLLGGLALLAACAPVTTFSQQPGTGIETSSTAAKAMFTDPFAYCRAVGTISRPDSRYTGPKTPDPVVIGVIHASGAPADVPQQDYRQGTIWRCMDHQVYACFVGANLPCEEAPNSSLGASPAMKDYCAANPSSVGVPASVTGHNNIYIWFCKDGKAVIDRQAWHIDAQGYIKEIWYPILPPTQ